MKLGGRAETARSERLDHREVRARLRQLRADARRERNVVLHIVLALLWLPLMLLARLGFTHSRTGRSGGAGNGGAPPAGAFVPRRPKPPVLSGAAAREIPAPGD